MEGGQKMTLSMSKIIREIKKLDHKEKKYTGYKFGGGLYLIIEPKKNKCKHFVGLTKYPRGTQKTVSVPLGVFEKDIKTKEDLNKVIFEWDLIKSWSKETGKDPRGYRTKDEIQKSQTTLEELFNEYLEFYKQTHSENTYVDRKRKFGQILKFFGEKTSITDLEWDRGGRSRVLELVKSIKKRNAHDHAIRTRSVLKGCFNFAINNDLMRRDQNPASIPFDIEKKDHNPKNNPSISWKEVPELFEKINSASNSIITKNSMYFYFMTCLRVGAIVRMKWDWIDEKSGLIVVPPDTSGLKRTLSKKTNKEFEHYIPITKEIELCLNSIRGVNGDKEYLFWTPDSRKLPHQHPETINRTLVRLGYKDKQNAHGWRRVIVTYGQEIGKFDRDIIQRQIGHTEHRMGAIGSYDKSQKLNERRKFMKWWTKELVKKGMVFPDLCEHT